MWIRSYGEGTGDDGIDMGQGHTGAKEECDKRVNHLISEVGCEEEYS